MTLSPQWLDELRARTLLSSVIAPSVKLIRAGREWKACCPFHNEKTPSFTINDEKGFYHCFGCGAHGDAIRFLTDARGLPFMDAVKEGDFSLWNGQHALNSRPAFSSLTEGAMTELSSVRARSSSRNCGERVIRLACQTKPRSS